jgi:4-hydroxybenzoate polyprenyltransferase
MIFSGSAFSDIKDTTGDKKEGLKTLAITMGHKNLISFLMFVTLLAMVPIVAGVYINVLPVYALALFFGVAYRVFLFKKSFDKNINKHLLYAVLFDGELTLWVILVILGRTLA